MRKDKYHKVRLIGGPWAKKLAVFPAKPGKSLTFRVGKFFGCYDFQSGMWFNAE